MQLKFLVLAALQGFAAAQTTVFSSQVCVTSSGRISVSPIRRTTITSTTGLTIRTTVCPAARTTTRTVTPPFVTATSTVSVTSLSTATTVQVTSTDTSFVTADPVTVFNTVTVTSTATTGSTSTVTETTTSTVTQPPPPGFTNLADEPDYVAKKKKKRSLAGRIPLLKRTPCRRRKPRTGSGSGSGSGSDSGSDADSGSNSNLNPIRIARRSYPQTVRCLKIVKTVSVSTVVPATCVRTRSTTVTLATSTSTELTTTTEIVTSTVTVPTATVVTVTVSPTVTGQTTVTETATTTTTATTTVTATAPAQTVYAACGARNLVSSANGGHQFSAININTPGGPNQVFSRTANSAYECCVACLQATNCIFSYYDNSGGCDVVIGDTCNPQDAMGTSFETSEDGNLNYVLSNGPCGRVANGGDV